MTTTSQYETFSELYTGLQQLARETTGSGTSQDIAKRLIDSANHDIYVDRGERFQWTERRATIITHAEYNTGTVAVTLGSGTITGTSTAWDTATGHGFNNMRVGGKVTIAGSYEVYEVTAIASDTSATISPAYIGATDSGLSYTYFEDEYALAAGFDKPKDQRSFDTGCTIHLKGREDFRRMYPRNRSPSDYPRIANVIDLPFSGNTTPVRKIRFAPPPASVTVIPYNYVSKFYVVASDGTEKASFTADTDHPIMPVKFRHAIVLKALEILQRNRKGDVQKAAQIRQDYEELIGRMMSDQDLGHQRARMKVSMGGRRGRSRRPWGGRRGGRRYDTDGEFDRFDD